MYNYLHNWFIRKFGTYLGSYSERKYGFGPEFWTIDVFELKGKLYGGDVYEGVMEPMVEEMRNEILYSIKKRNL